MENILQTIRDDKRKYRAQMQRVKALPEGYRFVYEKAAAYLWSFAGGSGLDMLQTQYELIDLFEAGAAQGKHVLDITGRDVAGFCDALMQGNRLWTDNVRKRLNRSMRRRLEP